MGAYCEAEVCKLVSIFVLNKITKIYNKNDVGLHTANSLAVFKYIRGPELERIKKKKKKKKNQSLLKPSRLEIITECNKKVVDYLDVTFSLKDGTCKPYQKTENKITDINVQSNLPQT